MKKVRRFTILSAAVYMMMAASPAPGQEHTFHTGGWTIVADVKESELSIEYEPLGMVLHDVQLHIKEGAGWKKLSKKAHATVMWLIAFAGTLSAVWILIANAWMQSPVGTSFNMDSARNEMINIIEVILSPTAIFKFLHTISSAYVISALFVVSISAWYILKSRHTVFAKKSILIATVFGLLSSVFVAFTGDSSAYDVAHKQPMKLAAMEGLYDGERNAEVRGQCYVHRPGRRSHLGRGDLQAALSWHLRNYFFAGCGKVFFVK